MFCSPIGLQQLVDWKGEMGSAVGGGKVRDWRKCNREGGRYRKAEQCLINQEIKQNNTMRGGSFRSTELCGKNTTFIA